MTIAIFFDIIILYFVFTYYYRISYEVTEHNRYETFGRRFWAGAVDGIVYSPIDYIVKICISYELNVLSSLGLLIISSFGYLIYSIISHGLFGQTIGKWLCRVKVMENNSLKPINLKVASIRDGIPVALLTTNIIYFLSQSDSGKTFFEKITKLLKNGETGFNIVAWISILWFICEVATMLTNKKRRALHDYLAGTVVIRV
jgi:uncharacterized RDD family membrane protein YckC